MLTAAVGVHTVPHTRTPYLGSMTQVDACLGGIKAKEQSNEDS